VDFFAGEAEIFGRRFNVLVWSLEISGAPMGGHLFAFLRRIVFVGEATLRQRFDL
jgi:hypothetical protein